MTPAQGFGRAGCPEYQTTVVGITCVPPLVSVNLLQLINNSERHWVDIGPLLALSWLVALINLPATVFWKSHYPSLSPLLAQERPSAPVTPSTGNVCSLPRDEGPCDTWKVRFYYDSGTGKCTEFWYGSCQGNANNFVSLELCQRECGGVVRESPSAGQGGISRRGSPRGALRVRS